MSKNPATSIVDVGCQTTPVSSYYFLAAAAGQTVAGFFVDAYGNRTGASFSLSLSAANGTNDALPLPSIPSDAIGAIARFSGTTYVDFASGTTDDFEDNYANYPQLGPSDGNVFIGRVNS